MQLDKRINAFVLLGEFINQFTTKEYSQNSKVSFNDSFFERMIEIIQTAKSHNGWFTRDNIHFSLKSWADALTQENLNTWTSEYTFNKTPTKTIGLVLAGNIPLVGFHDFLSVLISGNNVVAKLSSNDQLLLPILAEYLIAVEPKFEKHIRFTKERLTNFNAVIATGSNNTARYFEYYFGKYPNIIRKNRNSVAILTGNETQQQLEKLADDIFRYFGLGCRNVSKLYVPKNYNFDSFFKAVFSWNSVIKDNKYMNNYDYNKAVYLMSKFNLLDNEFLLLKEDTNYSSPISVLFYETYENIDQIKGILKTESQNIQCIVSNIGIKDEIDFGETQNPQLWDYADNVDTLEFLATLPE